MENEVKNSFQEMKSGAESIVHSKDNKKILAGILAILFGAFGIHKFVLGYTKEGLILLGITVLGWVTSILLIGLFFVWIPGLIGLIEGIVYLTKTDDEFYNTYQVGRRPWF